MALLKLAFKNVFRSRRRTLITFSAVALGLALLILSRCLINGVDRQSTGNIINSMTSHIAIFNEGYYDKIDELPMDQMIASPAKL
ncbi:MAG: hypothetical protein GY765_21170, partial [bacterium]|nr:hypothetical protein [bacterium]